MKREIPCLNPGIESRFPVRRYGSLITIPTELIRVMEQVENHADMDFKILIVRVWSRFS